MSQSGAPFDLTIDPRRSHSEAVVRTVHVESLEFRRGNSESCFESNEVKMPHLTTSGLFKVHN